MLENQPLVPYLEKFERAITHTLLDTMTSVVLLATVELAWFLVRDVLTLPLFLLDIHEPLELFGLFLMVLIGIELLHSAKTTSLAVDNVFVWITLFSFFAVAASLATSSRSGPEAEGRS